MALAVGDVVPEDLTLLTPAGERVQTGSVMRGEPTLVIFLRHLG
jgi:hypothetical protein